ncbi:5'-methylthioadenosine/S-adenosylhomocysteine nucleosidase [Chlamydiales bacterium SCGC AB-751-O23]|jgi:adenosylhomocysteine nucleosidase|nr:5'-methylthioadenosine/S-adenosylhomocysteine nucleosidase [Chlamydiales bacterium SCGC AB-751-O23]
MKFGIMGAMPQEVDLIKNEMLIESKKTIGNRTFYSGSLYGSEVILAFSRWGKVAAASVATSLLDTFKVDFLLFTGVAGAVGPNLNVGDIVIGEKLYQHDMDARPLFPRFRIPLTEVDTFNPRSEFIKCAEESAKAFLKEIHSEISQETLSKFSILSPKVIKGTIATGDQFIANPILHEGMKLNDKGETAHAVEMEGAAVAQVCEEYSKPYLVIRTISDKADHSAHVDFQAFIELVSNHFSKGIVQRLIPMLSNSFQKTLA